VRDFPPVDYLVIGHFSRDRTPTGSVAGGTVTYAGLAAAALGLRVGVLTSAAAGDEVEAALPGLEVVVVEAAETTVFENVMIGRARQQKLHALAGRLGPEHVPPAWRRTPMVHLGPIAAEIEPAIASIFSNSQVGATPQGWYRRWNASGEVYAVTWRGADDLLPQLAAAVLSIEDLPDAAALEALRRRSRILVVTLGALGCDVYVRGESRRIAAPDVEEVSAIGAGDIFAAAFFLRLYQTRGNAWAAAAFANRIAARSVTVEGLRARMAAIRAEMVAA
jgi:sugar/nucleoside kinase (ribokinase family)